MFGMSHAAGFSSLELISFFILFNDMLHSQVHSVLFIVGFAFRTLSEWSFYFFLLQVL
jgi:hypothetical protein